ncbi:MAG: hypothetical protein A2390_02855 [Candidatus Liptonbacteria bacterium RIFOXYB1_FULL_36_10]|uniref:HTH deoR-type domain-containing protein n=2 Tax=Candidatus Liptoniibacteriota TaxID=1817909 RepID=A0A1G2CM10_9BACT|nr:MAG: hypothetical protein A2390_02855 [Candidatus Liptonbacteria bacterium RIFOXYB1_FULL_36_10]OGZ03399.1 MAG: hypothetical protein A2604_00505 [Candidatus Liptonbacteria bacterium RIFOXYD1_FULL_36_11]
MLPNKLPDDILRLSYELAYIVFRVAEQIKQSDLEKKMKAGAVLVIEAVLFDKIDLIREEIFKIRIYSSFANDIGLISFNVFSSLVEKLKKTEESLVLSEATQEVQDIYDVPTAVLGINQILEESKKMGEKRRQKKEEEKNGGIRRKDNFNSGKEDEDDVVSKDTSVDSSASGSVVRQGIEFGNSSAIRLFDNSDSKKELVFERVKELKVCFLRDLMDAFPECKERTLRYNLENLVKEERVEKIGTSGPGTFYRVI